MPVVRKITAAADGHVACVIIAASRGEQDSRAPDGSADLIDRASHPAVSPVGERGHPEEAFTLEAKRSAASRSKVDGIGDVEALPDDRARVGPTGVGTAVRSR